MGIGWLTATAWASGGTVTVPLATWEETVPPPAPACTPAALPVQRTLAGTLHRGQLEGTLTARVEVRCGPVAVPLVGRDVTVLDATLDGRPAALRDDGSGQWVVDVGPGVHDARIQLLQGAPTDRFARELRVPLPGGGPTAVDLVVPEPAVTPSLRGGVVTEVLPAGDATRVRGALAAGDLALAWERSADVATPAGAAHVDARTDAVVSLGEDLVTGTARLALTVREGEIDRVTVDLPPALEVLDVTGGDVLQWHTEDGSAVVLLRHLAQADVAADVRFQYPVQPGTAVPLLVPRPRVDGRTEGAVGVAAPVGLEVAPGDVGQGRLLAPRDVPVSLLALTDDPLRATVAFDGEPPAATVDVARQADLRVAPTRIDDLQAITVVTEDGAEVGKLRLAVRNTTRQVLTVDLPEGAVLTHCFRDGVPLRPAASDGHPERMLVPLTRSEARERQDAEHVVEAGDMLSTIAQRYYGDASRWRLLVSANPGLDPSALRVGQHLRVPSIAELPAEAAFTLELGWERHGDPLALAGLRDVALPALDLDVMAANWHLYLPERLVPLWVGDGAVRLDVNYTGTLHRLLDAVVTAAVPGEAAYAGEAYRSALELRRKDYLAEQQAEGALAGDPFPLVGHKYRLRGVLLGDDTVATRILWIAAPVADAARWVVLAGVAALTFAAARWRRAAGGIALAVGLVAVAALGHALLGVYGRALWGAVLGLAAALIGRRWAGARWVAPRRRAWWAAPPVALVALVWWLLSPSMLPVFAAALLLVLHRRHR
ncbi:MAG: LysM domain-containing protein [Myxococcota bacterium]